MGRTRSFRALRALAALAATGSLLVAAAPAAADHPGDGTRVVRPAVGPPVLTHGPDPRSPSAAGRPMARAQFATGLVPRQPACSTGNYLHFIYARPAGARNRLKKSKATIRTSIQRTNALLNAESLASGGTTADYRVRCDTDGQITVDSIISPGGSFAELITAARTAGFASPSADYLIFYEGSAGSACGTATIYNDDRLVPTNAANRGGGYGVAYAGCWTEETPMHEISHMMGAVQYSAPNSTGTGGHCIQEADVLCYSPDGGDLNQTGTVTNCPGMSRFDCGFDDYFDAAPEPGEYLYSHWNVGSPLNSMIAFGGGAQGGGFTDAVTGLIQDLLLGGQRQATGTGVGGVPGEWRLYEIEVTGGAKTLTVTLDDAASPSMTLYVRSRRAPSTVEYRCKARVRGVTATCTIPRPRGGPWVAGVLSGDGAAGANYKLRAKLAR